MTVVEPDDPANGDRPDDSALRALGIDPWAEAEAEAEAGADADAGGAGARPADHRGSTAERDPLTSGVTGDEGYTPDPFDEVPVADTPLWLSHHWPQDYDRCAVVAGLHVCRRCLVLYPLALVAGIAVSIGSWWDHSLDPWVLWLMPLPGVIEFVLDNLRLISYRPVRQMVLSAGGALAAGVGYVRYLDDTTDRLAWTVLAVYTAATLSAAIVGGLWRRRTSGRDAAATTGEGRSA